MNELRNILALIGLGTVVYFFYQYWEARKLSLSQIEKDRDNKIKKLSLEHPEISKLFNEFEYQQSQAEKHQFDGNYDEEGRPILERGQTYIILGKAVRVFHTNEISGFKEKVLSKLTEIESTVEGRAEIERILLKYRS